MATEKQSKFFSYYLEFLRSFHYKLKDSLNWIHRSIFANVFLTLFLCILSFEPDYLYKKYQEDYGVDENGFRREVEGRWIAPCCRYSV